MRVVILMHAFVLFIVVVTALGLLVLLLFDDNAVVVVVVGAIFVDTGAVVGVDRCAVGNGVVVCRVCDGIRVVIVA